MGCNTRVTDKMEGLHFCGIGGNGNANGQSCMLPMRGRRPLPPPFLMKIYEMVDDPNTNSIISWSPNNTSFIILNQIKFTSELLPKYFKHGNFASFVYQLNNYGFRKISWEKYEYENPWFQAGKRHWLTNIKRRGQISEPEITEHTPLCDSAKVGIMAELDTLRSEQNSMKAEVQKLRRQQEEMEKEFNSFQETMKLSDSEHEEMVIPLLVQQLVQHLRERGEIPSNENRKKQKVDTSGSTDISQNPIEKGDSSGQNAEGNDQVQDELTQNQPEGQILSSPQDSGGSNQNQKVSTTSGNAENIAFWKEILEDDAEHENAGEEELAEHDTKFTIKLEDLMASNYPIEAENSVTLPLDDKVEEEGCLKVMDTVSMGKEMST